MAGPTSFRDSVTGRLKAWGFMNTNAPGDLARAEPEGFNLKVGEWTWNGTAWVAVPPATLATEKVTANRNEATALLSSPEGIQKLLRAAFDVARDEINVLRSVIPRYLVSITRVGTVATATCFLAHGLSNNEQVFIGGADVAAYNGAKTITVTGATTFTFTVAGSPATPATGSIAFALGTVTQLEPRTFLQFRTAISARIADGSVDV